MAVLRSYFSICTLVTPRGLLGAEPDSRSGAGLITLSKNVLMRYKFSDQKEIGGWTSKDFITAPVVFDRSEKNYVGVFNENVLKVWQESVESLDKVKKIKFSQPIFKLISDDEGKTTLIFKDGSCAALSYALFARKNLENASFLEKDEAIIDARIFNASDEKLVCFITKQKNIHYVITCHLNLDINTLSIEKLKRIEIKRDELVNGRIIGTTISTKADTPLVHVMWSDGRLFSLNVLQNHFNLIGHVPSVNHDVDVSLAWIGDNHLAVYGADSAQEGAILLLFNVSFGIVSCKYPLKLYCPGARVWCLPDHLLLEANQHLAVIPFSLSSHRNVLSLLGSNKTADSNENVDKIKSVDWGKGKIAWKPKEKWRDLAKTGMSERDISLQFIPRMIDTDDVGMIHDAMEEFTDIPENLIVSLILYVMRKFQIELKGNSPEDYVKVFRENKDARQLLDLVLNLPYIYENLITHLRKNLSFDNMRTLCNYITYMLKDTEMDTNFSFEFEQKLVSWGSIILDSHFQELQLSSRSDLDFILIMKAAVDEIVNDVNLIESALIQLNSFCLGIDNNFVEDFNDGSSYYIEEVKLF